MEIHPKIKHLIGKFNGVLIDYRNKTIYLDRDMDIKYLYYQIMGEFDKPEHMEYPIPIVRHTDVEYAPANGWCINNRYKFLKEGDVFYSKEYQEFLDWVDSVNNGGYASADEALTNLPKLTRKK